jgi:hypothetical protein
LLGVGVDEISTDDGENDWLWVCDEKIDVGVIKLSRSMSANLRFPGVVKLSVRGVFRGLYVKSDEPKLGVAGGARPKSG